MGVKKIPAAIRAQAIADLQAGDQPAIVAERYGLDAAQMRVWKQRYVTTVTPIVTPVQPMVVRQQAEIGALVLELLAAKLEASKAIAEAASDQAWLKQQTASELAALGEWLDTTAFAIGDRLARRGEQPEGESDA